MFKIKRKMSRSQPKVMYQQEKLYNTAMDHCVVIKVGKPNR